MADRPRSPMIPGNLRDRTGTGGIMRRALADIRRRYAGLQRDVVALFDAIPRLTGNDLPALPPLPAPPPRDIYAMTPEQLQRLSDDLRQAVERWMADGRDPQYAFWWDRYVAEASQLGTAQTVANLTALSSTYAASRTLAQVIYSEPYRNRLAMAQLASKEHWTGLAAQQKSDLAQIIGRAVVDGKSPRAVRKEIAEKLAVSKSRAEGYAQTDITDTLRQTRWAEADRAEEELGLRLGMLWTSAFLPTTRPWHASLHGQVRTTEQVRQFYTQGGNRYRCHCSQTECLLDADGRPILTKQLQSAMANERKTWQSQHGKA